MATARPYNLPGSVDNTVGKDNLSYATEDEDGKENTQNGTESNTRCHNDILETPEEGKRRRRSLIVLYMTTFLMSIGFSIVITSVWPYLKELDPSPSKKFLGWVIAIHPMGQMISSPFIGYLAQRFNCTRIMFCVTILMFASGNIIWALLPLFQSSAVYVMLVARLIVGLGSANQALCRSYISNATLVSERTTYQSLFAAFQACGIIFGPGLQTLLSILIPLDEDEGIKSSPFWNMYSAAGWIAAFLGLFNLLLYSPWIFKEYKIAEREILQLSSRANDSNTCELPSYKIDYIALMGVLVSFFSILGLFVILETIIVPMAMDLFAWTSTFAIKAAGIGFFVMGALAMVMFYLSSVLSKKFEDRFVYILFGLLPLTIGVAIHIPLGSTYPKIMNCTNITSNDIMLSQSMKDNIFPLYTTEIIPSPESSILPPYSLFANQREKRSLIVEQSDQEIHCTPGCPPSQEWCFSTPIVTLPQMVVAQLIIIIGYSVAFASASSIYSKLLIPSSQGFWMGIMTSTASCSRMIGPIFITYVYTTHGPFVTFICVLSLMVVVLIGNCLLYKRLVPLKIVPR